ncbi:unnamed protein product [Echinostoma caproni]|uniref:C2 domain-containing protein n=1 Tax=Echinostoma caproni TaxID=27848 RepID=A0A183A608_9TREM|nr:unnamed protein product [Echinostoma caproni]
MPLIEKANRIASVSIKQLHKKAFGSDKGTSKQKDKNRENRSSYYSDADDYCETNSRSHGKGEPKSLHRRAKQFIASAARKGSKSQLSQSSRSVSTGNLALEEIDQLNVPSDDASDVDVNSSVYDSTSFEENGAMLSRPIRLPRQTSVQKYPRSRTSSTSSRQTTQDESASVCGSFRDSRSRMRSRQPKIPQIQIDGVSVCSDLGQSFDDSEMPDSEHWNHHSAGQVEVLPREGFFWQILLYLRLARALPIRNPSGKIDAYVKVRYRGKTFLRTPIIANNRNPVWDEKFLFPINNLNYPLELRVCHRDAFKKDEYIGRAMVYPSTLAFGQAREFTENLHDETGRSVPQYSGELNFWMTLSEIPEMRVPSDRRRAMLKQIKEDRLHASRMTPVSPILSRSTLDVVPVSNQYMLHQQWVESTRNLSLELSHEAISDYGITSMDEYEPGVDEWLLPNAASFHQPQWPLAFYDGTKLEFYTTSVGNKKQCRSISQLTASKSGRSEVRLENYYKRARLLVNLIRAEELGFSSSPALKDDSSAIVTRSPSTKSKLITSRGMERAVLGRPIVHTDETVPAYVATLSIGKSSHKSRTVRSFSSPCWHQQFEFRLRLGEKTVLSLEITDHAVAVPMILFRGHLDFERHLPDWTGCFTLKNNLEGFRGHVVLLVTLTGLTSIPTSVGGCNSPSQDANGADRSSSEYAPSETVPISPKLNLPSKELLSMVESHYLANRRCKWYALKDKKLRKRAKGAVLLESYLEYNPVSAFFYCMV